MFEFVIQGLIYIKENAPYLYLIPLCDQFKECDSCYIQFLQ